MNQENVDQFKLFCGIVLFLVLIIGVLGDPMNRRR